MDHRQQSIAHNLETLAGLHEGSIADAISIKLRPVENAQEFSDRYVYPREYQELVEVFGFEPVRDAGYHGGHAYRVGQVDLVEHETGPEFLALIVAFGTAIGPYMTTVDFGKKVAGAAAWLWKKVKKNSETKSEDRYYHDAQAIKVETRRIAADGSIEETIITVLNFSETVKESELASLIAGKLNRKLKDGSRE